MALIVLVAGLTALAPEAGAATTRLYPNGGTGTWTAIDEDLSAPDDSWADTIYMDGAGGGTWFNFDLGNAPGGLSQATALTFWLRVSGESCITSPVPLYATVYTAGGTPVASITTPTYMPSFQNLSATVSGLSLSAADVNGLYVQLYLPEEMICTYYQTSIVNVDLTYTTDTTPPSGPTIINDGSGTDVDYQTTSNQLWSNWNAASDASGIAYYEWVYAASNCGWCWVANGTTTGLSASASLSLTQGAQYISYVRAVDNYGNPGTWIGSDLVTIDSSAPSNPGVVNDSLSTDVDWQTNANSLSMNWSVGSDPQSGIAYYQWVFTSTACGGCWVVSGTTTGTSVTAGSLSLSYPGVYYAYVQAFNNAGVGGGWTAVSDGIQVDTVLPTAPATNNDGSGADIDLQNNTTQLWSNWSAGADGQSGVSYYEWAYTSSACGGCWIANGTTTGVSATASGLSLTPGVVYTTHVRAFDVAGHASAWRSSDTIQINVAPSVPALVTPANAAIITSTTPALTATFADSNAGDTGRLDFQLCSDSGCASVLQSGSSASGIASGANGSWTTGALSAGTTYYWRARTTDANSLSSSYSATRSFTVNSGPNVPTLVSPANAGIVNTTTPALTGTFSDPNTGDTGRLDFQVCSDSGCASVLQSGSSATGIANGANGSWTTGALTAGTTYYWRARNTDANSVSSSYSATRSFTVNSTPSVPALVSPANGVIITSTTPALTGTFSDPNAGDTGRLDFQVCSDAGCASVLQSGSSSSGIASGANGSWTTGALTAGTTYYWRARNTDANSASSAYSATRSFIVNSAPSVPALVTPASAAVIASTTPALTATFSDPNTGDTGRLDFQLCSDSGCASVLQSGSSAGGLAIGANGSWTTGALTAGTTYYWRARTTDANSLSSAYSAARSFIVNSAPSVPALVTPVNAAIVGSTTPALTATFSDPNTGDTGRLDFQVCSDSGCASVLQSGSSGTGIAIGANGSWTTGALTAGATYYWRARTTDANGLSSGYSATRSFTVNSTPAVPALVSPADGVIITSTTPALTGTFSDPNAGDTGRLDFQVCSDSGCASVLQSGSSSTGIAIGANGSWTTAALTAGATYYWRARNTDANSASSAYSATRSFIVNSTPSVPALVTPGNAAILASTTPTLTGTFSDPNTGDSGRVDFQICSDSGCASVLQSGSSSTGLAIGANGSWAPLSTLTAGTTYYWRARNTDANALSSAYSATRSFTVNSTPNVPALVTPANAAIVSATPALTATFSDPNTGDTGQLDFQICSDSGCGSVVQSGSSVPGIAIGANGSWTAGALTAGATYYWRARTTDANGLSSAYSATRSFTVNSAPNVPALVSPANATIVASTTPVLTATFSDPNAGDTGRLDFQVCSDSGCASVLQSGSSSAGIAIGANGSWTTGALTPGATYYWRARNTDAFSASSAYSATRSFTVNSTPSVPALVSPTNATIVASTTPSLTATFSDAETGDTGRLDFQVCSDSGCASVLQSGSSGTGIAIGANGSWTTGALTPGTTYYWRARNTDASSASSAYSATRSFILNSTPSVPALVTPANAAVVASTTPALTATFSDPNTGDTGQLDFQICSDSGCASVLQSGSSSTGLAIGANGSWTPLSVLTAGTTYYWRARTTDANALSSAYSATRSFIVNSTPSVPAFVSPADAAVVNTTPALTATFSDANTGDTGRVDFQVCSDSACASVLQSGSSSAGIAIGANGSWTTAALTPGITYYWRARNTDAGALSSAYSATRSLTINSTPNVPALVSPTNATIIAATTPALTATFSDPNVADTGRLDFQLCSDAACSSVLQSGSSPAGIANGANGAWTTGALTPGTTYHWRARGTDAGAASSAYSATRSFTVNSTPVVPTLVTPLNAAVVASTTPALTATFSDTDTGDSGRVDFQVCSDSGCASVLQSGSSGTGIASGANGSWTPGALTVGSTYYWRARNTDATGVSSAYSATRSFIVNSIPNAPSLVTPANAVIVASTTPTLTASFSDSNTGDTGQLTFQVCSDSGCASVLQSGSSATGVAIGANGSWLVGGALTAGTTYHWRARATDAGGLTGAWTATRSFVVNTTPTVPVLATPANATLVVSTPVLTATFSDANTGDTGQVDFQVCSDAGCASVLQSGSSSAGVAIGANGSWTVGAALTPGSTYYWRARNTDANTASSPYSATRSFTVNTTPGVPALVSPANSTVVASTTPVLTATFSDTNPGDAGQVDFQVCSDAGCASVLQSGSSSAGLASGNNGSWTVASALTAGNTYHWRARNTDATGASSAYTATRSFVVNTPPAVPALVSPANSAYVASTTPALSATFSDSNAGDTGQIDFQLCSDAACSTVIQTGSSSTGLTSGANGTWTVGAPLTNAVQYWWRARTTDGNGISSSYSAIRSFTPDALPPDIPTLVAPASGAVFPSTPALQATYSDAAPATNGTVSFQVCDDAACASPLQSGSSAPVVSGSNGTWTPAALTVGRRYWWRAQNTDAAGTTSAYSAIRTFVVDTAPTVPVWGSPADGSWVTTRQPTLSAQFNDPDAAATGQLTFELCSTNAPSPWQSNCGAGYQLGTSPAGLTSGVSSQWAPNSDLGEGSTYYWRVAGTDQFGVASAFTSPARSFTIDSLAPSTPANLRTTARRLTTMTIAWDASTDATSGGVVYDVQSSTDAATWGAVGGCTAIATLTCAHTVAAADTNVYFRIRARDAAGNSTVWVVYQQTSGYPYYLRTTVTSGLLGATNRSATWDSGTQSPSTSVRPGNQPVGWYFVHPAAADTTSAPITSGEPGTTAVGNSPNGYGWIIDEQVNSSVAPGPVAVQITTDGSTNTGVANVQCRLYRITTSVVPEITTTTFLDKQTLSADVLTNGPDITQTCDLNNPTAPAPITSPWTFGTREALYLEVLLNVTTVSSNTGTVTVIAEDTSSYIALTKAGAAPAVPTFVNPADLARTAITPTFQAQYSHPAPENGTVDFQIATDTAFTNVVETGTSATVTSGATASYTPQADAGGTTKLLPGNTYYWRVRGRDAHSRTSSWSAGYRALVIDSAPATPTNVSPGNNSNTTLSPTLTASAFSDADGGDTHDASQWQMRTATGSYINSATEVAAATTGPVTSWAVPATLVDGSAYYWRVRYRDNYGVWSAWSTETRLVAQAAPSVSVTSTSPATAPQGRQGLVVQINGSGFAAGATASFSGGGITVTETTFVSDTRLDATIDVAGAAATTARNVTVTNTDLSSDTATGAFTITAPSLTLAISTLGYTDGARDSAPPNGVGFENILPGTSREIGPAGSGQTLAGSAVRLNTSSDTNSLLTVSAPDFSGPSPLPIGQLAYKHNGVSEGWTSFTTAGTPLEAAVPPGSAQYDYDLQLTVPAGQLGGSYDTTVTYTLSAVP